MESPKRSLSRTIFIYITKEACLSFFVSFLFFFFIFFVNQLLLMAQEILTKRVPFFQVALLILYSLPSIIAMAAPFAALVGTLMTIGRISSDNEALVMLSAGLSYANIFLPAFAVGLGISLMSFFANDVLLPAGTLQFVRLYRRILFSTPALELESNSVKRFKDTVLVTGNVKGTEIDDILILDKTGDGERRVIMGRRAWLKESDASSLSLNISSAFIQSSGELAREDYDYASASALSYHVSHEDMMQSVSSIGPREMSSRDVRREIKVKEHNLDEKLAEKKNLLMNHAMAVEQALRQGRARPAWNRREAAYESFNQEAAAFGGLKKDRSLLIFRLEYYKKFSIPFGAISFIFLAVPLGLFARKSGQTVGFIFGLIISVFYWAMLLGGQTMGIRLGYSPFWSMWFPDLFAVFSGIALSIIKVRQ